MDSNVELLLDQYFKERGYVHSLDIPESPVKSPQFDSLRRSNRWPIELAWDKWHLGDLGGTALAAHLDGQRGS
jgi:hypothetical protein